VTRPLERFGSHLGGVATIITLSVMSFYMFSLFRSMAMGESDIINTMVFTNTFKEGSNSVNMSESIFMPYFSIEQSDYNIPLSDFDIFDNGTEHWNASKVRNYIELVTDIQIRDSSIKDVIIPFRNCRVEDFSSRKYVGDSKFQSSIPNMLCPNTEKFKDLYIIKNGYTNYDFRQSFSIKVLECNIEVNPNCRSSEEQKNFLKAFYFTMYTVFERVEFTQENMGKEVMKTLNQFHSQFKLNLKEYRDNNNFLRINTVEKNDDRWLGFF
jgi:hypothetical protein